ncbi:ESX secretion-associated protein EspG [Amycolatopsis sulphurea]|nr:ESX secretion-associated protein EspG [Amycolatopsis sulphurea]
MITPERAVMLPAPALGIAWDMLDLGPPHRIFGSARFWADAGARRELHAATIDLLTEFGLADRGTPTPGWRATLQLIAYAEAEYYAWSGWADGTRQAALVAQRAQNAVLVLVREEDGGTVEIRPIPPHRLAIALLDTLPPLPGATVRRVSVTSPSETAPDLFDERDSHEYLTAVLNLPQEAVHQLYVARRAHGRRLSGGPITALDLETGRALTYPTADGRVELIPGDPRAIVKILNDAIEAL